MSDDALRIYTWKTRACKFAHGLHAKSRTMNNNGDFLRIVISNAAWKHNDAREGKHPVAAVNPAAEQ
jgi:hypothetical protein